MQEPNFQQRLLAAVLCATLAFIYPLLSLASHSYLIFGLPVLYVYLFGFWLVFIISVRKLVGSLEGRQSAENSGNKRAQ